MPLPRRPVPVGGAATLLLLVAVAVLLAVDGAAAIVYGPSSEASRFLASHNAARRAVGVPPLAWSAGLEATARAYALLRARTGCALVHSHGPFGENLFRGSGAGGWAPEAVVAAWVVKERAMYDYRSNTCRGGAPGPCGHYTQVVWRTTSKVGCAMAKCAGGQGTLAVCAYNPPGNYVGVKPY